MINIDEKALNMLGEEEKNFDKRNEKFFYIKVAICHWHDNNGLHMRKDIRVLSRKSGKGWKEWFDEDCSMTGGEHMFKHFKDLDEGIYKVTFKEYRDWETGYVDGWDYITEKI